MRDGRTTKRKANMSDKTYNGWTNYETWLVALWIDNDSGSYGFWRDTAREVYEQADADRTFSKEDNAKITLSKHLQGDITDAAPETTGLYCDLLTGALQEVNWYEIASNWIDEVAQVAA